ncbi:MAG: PIG-L family deacetylase, partial [Chloroflexota bacterium]|nr:PIG-L family deacetylase [Chloroflexota bacterium]
MSYDALVITAHPDDAETQMGGTLAKLSRAGKKLLVVDLTLGEPSDLAPGERARQAAEAARILGVDRITLHHQDRMLVDD